MKRWYVIQVFPGYEKIVKADIVKRIEEESMQDFFGDVLVPSAKMKQFFASGDELQDQQLFPGYILVEMEAVQRSIRLILSTPRVVRFLGGKEPVAISNREIDRIRAQIHGEMVISGEKHSLEVGKEFEIVDGPFSGFVGIIEAIDEESEKVTVMVSIFGRMTPVELNFDQIKH